MASVIRRLAKQMDGARRKEQQLVKLPLLFCLVALQLTTNPADALSIGDPPMASIMGCSRKCESEHCSMPPLLRYGKYCGILYTGCPGEMPCDGLDSCCQTHDACVQANNNDYLSQGCNEGFLDCASAFRDSGAPTFEGNKCNPEEVVDVISPLVQAALLVGRALHEP